MLDKILGKILGKILDILIYLTYLICLTLSQCNWKDIETRPGGSFVGILHWVVELLI